MDLKIKQLDKDLPVPSYAHEGDAGLDLYAAADSGLLCGMPEAVPTGVAVAIPDGYVGLICPRSGLAARHGISVANAPGVLDSGYRGEVKVLLYTVHGCGRTVRRGDRIAQLVVVPAPRPTVTVVDELDDTARSQDGFGSTGR